jgi:hypothetical protein
MRAAGAPTACCGAPAVPAPPAVATVASRGPARPAGHAVASRRAFAQPADAAPYHRVMPESESKPSWGSRIIAVLVLAVGAWILFKLVIGTVVAIAWAAAAIVAVIAVIWAIRTLT